MAVRLASSADAAAVTETITLAFHEDPLWSWAFPDSARRPEQYRVLWGMTVDASIEQQALWVDTGTVAVWVPPGGYELSERDQLALGPLLQQWYGDGHADLVLELFRRFEDHHPDAPFHYLSLLATHPSRRGHGAGMGLLAECLARTDARGEPALLESSNPANHERYERLGFGRIDEFHAPDGGPPVAVMWRDAPPTAG
jgi:GNAT superfamily N-acetyltransferase